MQNNIEIQRIVTYYNGVSSCHCVNECLSPLLCAAMCGDYTSVDTFLCLGGDVNKVNKFGDSLLFYAFTYNYHELIKVLIKHNVDVNALDNRCNNSVMRLHSKEIDELDYLNNLKLLVNAGLDINTVNIYGESLLIYLIFRRLLYVAKYIVECGANVNIKNDRGITPLMTSIFYAGTWFTKILIDHDADVNLRDNSGKTALVHACIREHNHDVLTLLIYNADIGILDNDDKSAWSYLDKNSTIIEMIRTYLDK